MRKLPKFTDTVPINEFKIDFNTMHNHSNLTRDLDFIREFMENTKKNYNPTIWVVNDWFQEQKNTAKEYKKYSKFQRFFSYELKHFYCKPLTPTKTKKMKYHYIVHCTNCNMNIAIYKN